MNMLSMICGHPVGRAPDDVLVRALANMPAPSKAAQHYDFDYTTVWLDVFDECKFRNLIPDWEAWSRDRHLMQ